MLADVLIIKQHRGPLFLTPSPDLRFMWGERLRDCLNSVCRISSLSLRITPGHFVIGVSQPIIGSFIPFLVSRKGWAKRSGRVGVSGGGQVGPRCNVLTDHRNGRRSPSLWGCSPPGRQLPPPGGVLPPCVLKSAVLTIALANGTWWERHCASQLGAEGSRDFVHSVSLLEREPPY